MPFEYCVPAILSLDELARSSLPSHTFPSDVYRQFFLSERQFPRAVLALEQSGALPVRDDHTYRLWDVFHIADRLIENTLTVIHSEPQFLGRLRKLERAAFFREIPEEWWETAEAARVGSHTFREECYSVRTVGEGSGRRQETDSERQLRLDTTSRRVQDEFVALADTHPENPQYWKNRLAAHAGTVIAFRDTGFDAIARLCAQQLEAATKLAQLRLNESRRAIRALVGRVNADLTAPAITAACFSQEWKAFDSTLDRIDHELDAFNSSVGPELSLTLLEAERLLDFLDGAGLQNWYNEYPIAAWHTPTFFDQSHWQRVGVAFGRIRTLAVLVEEMLLAFAEDTGQPQFVERIERNPTLTPRIIGFIKGPTDQPCKIRVELIERLCSMHSIRPHKNQSLAERLGSSLTALGMFPGKDPGPIPQPTVEHLIAGLVVVRNFTGHRFPFLSSTREESVLEKWGQHLPAISRTLLWSVLSLWAMTVQFKSQTP